MEDEPIKPTKAPKPSAPKASAPKAPAGKPAAPKKAPAPKKVPTTAETATATSAPKAPKAAPTDNMSTEEAKQAELQSAIQGKKGGNDPKKKRTVKKLIFTLVLVLLVAAVAVSAGILIPKLLESNNEKEILVDIDENIDYGESVRKFSEEVKDYQMGDIIERGLSVKNNGEGDVFVCFKIEIYEKDLEDTDQPIEMKAIPTINNGLWTTGTITENVNGASSPMNCEYYYYNSAVKKGTTATLFKEYVVNAESSIANEYANKSVTVKVTVKFVNANVDKLSSQADPCWNNAPDTWKGYVKASK